MPAAKKTEETRKTAAAKTAEKKTAAKAAVKAVAEKAAEKKTAGKKAAPKKTEMIIQSPMGGNITPEAIMAKVGEADKVYIRVDENKAYWVRGSETGSVDLWD